MLIHRQVKTNYWQDTEKPQCYMGEVTQVQNTNEQPLTHLLYMRGWLPSIILAHRGSKGSQYCTYV